MLGLSTIWLKIQAFWIEIAAAAVILILVFFLGYNKGGARVQHKWDAATAAAYQKSAEEAATLATAMQESQEKYDAALKALSDQRDAAIASVRNRPDRVPATAAATCQGATGAQLSKSDAEFLIGQSADSSKWQRALIACYAREDELRAAMIGNRK